MKPTRNLIAEFTVPGEPVSKSRARFTKRGSKSHAYTPQKTLEGEMRVGLAFRQATTGLPLAPTETEVAYRVEAEFYNGTRQRRDVDNMTKLILDGLNGVAWVDDNQVLEIESRKTYVAKDDARTVVRIFEIGRITPPTSKCVRCGRLFRIYESWRSDPTSKKYCSRECAYAHRVERRRRICAQCGDEFLAKGKGADVKFCSRDCRSAHDRTTVDCTNCGTRFTKQTCHVRKVNLCSTECQKAYAREQARLRRTKYFPGICEVCGAGTTRKEYHRCNACKLANAQPSGKPEVA